MGSMYEEKDKSVFGILYIQKLTYASGDAVGAFACLLLFRARSLSPCVKQFVSSSSLYWISGGGKGINQD